MIRALEVLAPHILGVATMTENEEATIPPTLASKLDRLFRLARPPGQEREYTYKEVAAAIADRGGPGATANYLYLLRTGRRDNPAKKLLEALASFFGTNVSYFYDDAAPTEGLEEELRLVAALRDSSIRQLALRSVDLSKGNLTHIMGIVEQVRELEGLPREARPPKREWSDHEPDEPEDPHNVGQ